MATPPGSAGRARAHRRSSAHGHRDVRTKSGSVTIDPDGSAAPGAAGAPSSGASSTRSSVRTRVHRHGRVAALGRGQRRALLAKAPPVLAGQPAPLWQWGE
ncbi:hypothetical protein ON010_g10312 [Phytophthora cinnamomi]|nr:hypothetical protein ON010_g10312 [Phytophthora cinnamomi]